MGWHPLAVAVICCNQIHPPHSLLTMNRIPRKISPDKIRLTFESIAISINPWWLRQWASKIKFTQDLKHSKWCNSESSATSHLHWINMSKLHHVTSGGGRRWNLGIIWIWSVKLVFRPTETRKKGPYLRHQFDRARSAVVKRKFLLLSLIGTTTWNLLSYLNAFIAILHLVCPYRVNFKVCHPRCVYMN